MTFSHSKALLFSITTSRLFFHYFLFAWPLSKWCGEVATKVTAYQCKINIVKTEMNDVDDVDFDNSLQKLLWGVAIVPLKIIIHCSGKSFHVPESPFKMSEKFSG